MERDGMEKEKNIIIKKKIKFEGEYLNGLKWNGIIYNYNKDYNLEIKNGNGKGREYNKDGKLMFEGEYINGKKNGRVIKYDHNSYYIIFKGYYLNGKRNGRGKGYDYNGGDL